MKEDKSKREESENEKFEAYEKCARKSKVLAMELPQNLKKKQSYWILNMNHAKEKNKGVKSV